MDSSSSALLRRRLSSLADSDPWEAEEKEAAASEERHVDCHLLLPRLRPEGGRGKHRKIIIPCVIVSKQLLLVP